jgi:hypothetical protein
MDTQLNYLPSRGKRLGGTYELLSGRIRGISTQIKKKLQRVNLGQSAGPHVTAGKDAEVEILYL